MKIIIVETPACPVCKKSSSLRVPEMGYKAWHRGMKIQNALPQLTADEREMLITGAHPDCWDELWCSCEEATDPDCPVHGEA